MQTIKREARISPGSTHAVRRKLSCHTPCPSFFSILCLPPCFTLCFLCSFPPLLVLFLTICFIFSPFHGLFFIFPCTLSMSLIASIPWSPCLSLYSTIPPSLPPFFPFFLPPTLCTSLSLFSSFCLLLSVSSSYLPFPVSFSIPSFPDTSFPFFHSSLHHSLFCLTEASVLRGLAGRWLRKPSHICSLFPREQPAVPSYLSASLHLASSRW